MTVRITMQLEGAEPEKASEYIFAQDVITFGRANSNILVIADPEKQVSSRHGRFEKRDGEWYVVDLKSTNGTMLNDHVVPPEQPQLVRDGDALEVGDYSLRFEVMAVPSGADQTMVHFDPERIVDKLVSQLTVSYADHLDDNGAVRNGAMGQLVRTAVRDLVPEHARAVLNLLKSRMSEGGATQEDEVDRQEELYRAGHEILKSLSKTYVSDDAFRRPEDAGRFGQLLNQTLHITMDWLAKCLEGRREFETQFGADVTMMFSLEGNPLKNGQDAEQISRYLLDWRGGRDISRVRSDLSAAFRDLTMHQLGLLAGAQEAVKAVPQRLDPDGIEELATTKSKGWLSVLPGGHKEWDYYKQAYAELLDEKTRLYEELISPNIRRGYLAAHEKQYEEGSSGSTDSSTQ